MGPFTAKGYLERGVARLEKGENDEAMSDFDEAIRRTPHYAKAFYYRALLKSRLNDAYSAIADAESALKWRGKKGYPEAIALLEQSRSEVARKQEAERQRREQAEAERLRKIQEEQARQKALADAERLRREAEEQARKQAEAEAARQKALIEAGRLRKERARKQANAERLRKAQEELARQQALAKKIKRLSKSGLKKLQSGDNAGAFSDYNELLLLTPGNAEAFRARQQALAKKIRRLSESGFKKLQSGDNAGALSDYNELLLLTPGNAEAFRDRGLTKMNLGKFAEAIDDFEKAIVLKMEDFPAASALLEIARRKLADATVTPPPPAAVPSQIGSPAASPPQGFAIIPYAQLKFTGRALGEGGFGKVSEAEWQFIKVAVKQLKKSQLTESSLLEFRQEAERHGALRHPHIVALFGVCLEQAKYCMVMELMVRGSLYQLLHTAQDLPWQIRLSIAKDMVVGLAYLHDQQIIHCDLKSLNVLLDGNLRAKLADFGLSKVKSEIATTSSAAASTAGTLLWMAPELFDRGGKCSYASDIYALAVTLWELSSRKLPFADAASPALVMQWVREGEREAIPAETPPQLAHLIGRGWVQCPADRPTAKQVAEQLMREVTVPDSGGYKMLSS